jgi:hypothetical protein
MSHVDGPAVRVSNRWNLDVHTPRAVSCVAAGRAPSFPGARPATRMIPIASAPLIQWQTPEGKSDTMTQLTPGLQAARLRFRYGWICDNTRTTRLRAACCW